MEEKNNCDDVCTCECQEGGVCTCGCEDGNCTCDETCTCGC